MAPTDFFKLTEQQKADSKVVAEYDGWVLNGMWAHPNRRGVLLHLYDMGHRTSWSWQIPVWSKLCKTVKLSSVIKSGYNAAVEHDKPLHGFSIIVSIIKKL